MCVAAIAGSNEQKGRLVMRIGKWLELDVAQDILTITREDLENVISDLYDNFDSDNI
jgi:hypothetical protein